MKQLKDRRHVKCWHRKQSARENESRRVAASGSVRTVKQTSNFKDLSPPDRKTDSDDGGFSPQISTADWKTVLLLLQIYRTDLLPLQICKHRARSSSPNRKTDGDDDDLLPWFVNSRRNRRLAHPARSLNGRRWFDFPTVVELQLEVQFKFMKQFNSTLNPDLDIFRWWFCLCYLLLYLWPTVCSKFLQNFSLLFWSLCWNFFDIYSFFLIRFWFRKWMIWCLMGLIVFVLTSLRWGPSLMSCCSTVFSLNVVFLRILSSSSVCW